MPPVVDRLAVYMPRSSVPELTVRFPDTAVLIANETIFELLDTVKLLNAVIAEPAIVCAADPLKVTVPVPAVKAVEEALLSQLPPSKIEKLFAISVPEVIVRLLATL